jgi:hypothetical protein
MAQQTCQIEVWVVVDENGDYAAGNDEDGCRAAYGEIIEEDGLNIKAHRCIKVTLTVPLPVTVELTGTVPAIGEPSGLKVS